MSFWRAYLRAAGIASAILLAALWTIGAVDPELAVVWDVAALAPWVVGYVLLFTLLLGSAGLCILRRLRWARLPCYAGTGLALGALLPMALFVGTGEPYFAGAGLLFGVMGASAAGSYWYARRA